MIGKRSQRILFYVIGLLAYYFIIKRLVSFEHWGIISENFKVTRDQIGIFILLLVLLVSNIFCEVKKWQVLIQPFYTLSLYNSLLQYLAGALTAVGSPARIAEPGGRMALLPKEHRLNALVMTSIGGFIQNIVIVFFGLLTLSFSKRNLLQSYNLRDFSLFPLILVVVSLLIISTLTILFRKKLKYLWNEIRKVKLKVLLYATFWTIVRYLIYNLQFYLWLLLFNIEIPIDQFILYSPLYFLIITIIPSFLLIDLGIRGSVSLIVFGNAIIPSPLLLSGVLGLWFFNVVLPAVCGGWVLYRKKGLK